MRASQALKIVGHRQPRVDGEEKVTGKALYTGDIVAALYLFCYKSLFPPQMGFRFRKEDGK